MNNSEDLTPTPKEAAMLRALRTDPSLAEAFEQLARISDDSDPECYSAEEKIHALGAKIEGCLDCDRGSSIPHSCSNRSCPRCQAGASFRWLDS